MSDHLIADAMSGGMRLAAQLSLQEMRKMMAQHESTSVEVVGEADTVACCEIYPLQEVDHLTGRAIEVRLLGSDGKGELYAYLYVPIPNE